MTAQLLHIGGTARGHLPSIVDPVDGVTALAPDSITYTIRRAGSDTAETLSSLTSLATGVYEWAYNPASETEGEQISIRFVITVTDSSTDTHTVNYAVDLVVVAVERGTDSANTATPLDAAGVRSAVGLANADLDDQIATLSTYDGSDTAGTSTLLSRLTATRAGYLDSLTNLDAAISSLNNLSALANLYGSPLLEIPDSSSIDYAFTLVVRDNEGKLKGLDASPTITAANASGTDRSANLSAVSNPSTGRYTFTYTVASTAVLESLRITCSGTISAEARYVEWIGAVVDYDTVTTLAAVKAKTDNLPSDPADQSLLEAAITSAVSTIQGTQASNAQTGAASALTADSSLSTLLTRIAGTIRTAADDGAAEATQTAAIQGTQQSNAQAGANAAIVANHLDHLLASAYDPASKPGSASGLLNVLVENDGGVPRYTANALEQAPAGGGGGSSTDYLLLQSTTIATLTSQTIFTLTEGSPDDDSYNGCILIIEDQTTAEQKAKCIINDYVGGSRTVTIRTAPAFTVATGDAVRIFAIGEGDMLDAPRVVSLASATWTADTIVGFPTSLNIGDSYVDEVNRAITIYYRDADENPVTAVGSKNLTDADFISELVISQGNRSGRIKILTGWTVASEGYLLIEIPQSETRRLAEGDATLQLTFKWDGGFEVVVATQTIQMLRKH